MPNQDSLASSEPPSEVAFIYHQCRRAILDWDWKPGSRLYATELQKRFTSKAGVVRAMYHLEAEGYISQTSKGRYIVTVVDEVEIHNHYRSIDWGYGEAIRLMIGFMDDGSISPKVVEIIEEVLQAAMLSKQAGSFQLDDIFMAKYYYILILASSRYFEMMNFILIADKLRYSRWIAEAIDPVTQDSLYSLNFQLQRNIAERSVSGATSLMTYIFEEYRRLIRIYLSTRPESNMNDKIDYSLVGDENPSNYSITPLIDSDHITKFIDSIRERIGEQWPHVFIDRFV